MAFSAATEKLERSALPIQEIWSMQRRGNRRRNQLLRGTAVSEAVGTLRRAESSLRYPSYAIPTNQALRNFHSQFRVHGG